MNLSRRLTADQQQFAATCLGLAYQLAGRYARSHGLDFDEALSAATGQLVVAARHFDPERGFAFSTYAHHAIRRALMQLAEREQRRRSRLESLDAILKADDPRVKAQLTDRRSGPADAAEVLDALARVREALPPRDWRLLVLCYERGFSTAEIAVSEGISRKRVWQLLKNAVERARAETSEGEE